MIERRSNRRARNGRKTPKNVLFVFQNCTFRFADYSTIAQYGAGYGAGHHTQTQCTGGMPQACNYIRETYRRLFRHTSSCGDAPQNIITAIHDNGHSPVMGRPRLKCSRKEIMVSVRAAPIGRRRFCTSSKRWWLS